jgi:hypothetical protein
VGKKSLTRKTDRQESKDRVEVRKAAAVADVVIPALTKQQMVDATSKALFLFNEKLLQVRKFDIFSSDVHPAPLRSKKKHEKNPDSLKKKPDSLVQLKEIEPKAAAATAVPKRKKSDV